MGTATTAQLSQTLAQLRVRVADRFGDYVLLTATSNGLATSFIDTINVTTASEYPVGQEIVFEDGSKRRVTGWTDTTGTLTFATLGATTYTATGKTAALYNKRGKGFLSAQYDRAINAAINDAFPLGLIEVRGTISAFDANTPEMTVPANMAFVKTLEWEDSDGLFHVIPMATRTSEYGWIADPGAGQLRLLGDPAWTANGFDLRITGFGRQDTLSSDSDTCLLDAEYVVSRACYHLALGALDKDPMYGQMVGIFLQESERKRSRIRTLDKGVRVRSY